MRRLTRTSLLAHCPRGILCIGVLGVAGTGAIERAVSAVPDAAVQERSALQHSPDVQLEREAYVMGTRLRVRVAAATREAAVGAIEAALAQVRRLESTLSSWRDDTEMSRLNSSALGRPLSLSPEFFSLLLELRGWVGKTAGAFDPAVGPLVDVWDLRGFGRLPSETELAAALARSGLDAFAIDEGAGTVVRLHDESWMTAGGFGKGAALRAVRRALIEAGATSALVDFGGQVMTLGSPAPGAEWTVAVAHPSERQRQAALIRLRDSSAATSAASERFVEIGGVRYGHIVDPRSGRPVPSWGSVTVVAEDPMVADLLSTALFVLGPEAAVTWQGGEGEKIAVLVLREEEGRIVPGWNAAMEELLVLEGVGVEVGS